MAFQIGDWKVGVDYSQPDTIPFDLFHVIVIYESDSEEGESTEFEAQAVSALNNKRQRPDIRALLSIAKESLDLLNNEFHKGAKELGFVFNQYMFPIDEKELHQQILDKLNEVFPQG